jgi:hypothetical protein
VQPGIPAISYKLIATISMIMDKCRICCILYF